MWLNLKRIIHLAWQSFSRNKGLSFQVIFIMAVAVFFVASFFVARGIGLTLLTEIEKKVDISIYFKADISEQDILKARDQIALFSDKIKRIDYVSSDEALSLFKQEHQDDPLYLNALDEIEVNPFLSSLNVYSEDPAYYAKISDFFSNEANKDMIEKISYEQPKNKQAVERLFAILRAIRIMGIIVAILLGLLVIVITSNIINLTFAILQEEIATMKLVGASNWFVRGPFIAQTIFYGLFAVLTVDLLSGIGIYFFNLKAGSWLLGFNVFDYFLHNFLLIFVSQLAFVLLLGVAATFLVMRKRLKA
ncbi:MAG: permease-like cell division protein FtsX [Candidatus Gribaldobacteria bacterium]|nr:permease-like cell division protein FtsX [Candidatus Gribaldobacteria bacterium]